MDSSSSLKENPEPLEACEDSHACPMCDKTFTKAQSLYGHLRSHGLKSGENSLSCQTCHVKFSSLAQLWKHDRIHNQTNRPFQCQICYKSFERYY
jgi:scratch-like protein